ncbi:MAG: ArsR family transcriptional regulator [Actinobacteria bacterium]|jgi:ArsR family transcriptional regulator|nr:autorepressor SdpR family transcription factor [Actinomycetota bacterium]PLS86312.1 MAG: ArsR family transcriptional regulator [Actinomycetota bacterium]
MDKVFKALGDPTRRGILRLLRSEEMSAGRIAQEFPVAKSTLSGHLNVLKEANLIVAERNGTTIVYSLNVGVYEEMLGSVMELLGVGAEEKEGKPDAYQPAD